MVQRGVEAKSKQQLDHRNMAHSGVGGCGGIIQEIDENFFFMVRGVHSHPGPLGGIREGSGKHLEGSSWVQEGSTPRRGGGHSPEGLGSNRGAPLFDPPPGPMDRDFKKKQACQSCFASHPLLVPVGRQVE